MDKIRYQKRIAQLRKQYEGKPCEVCGKHHDHTYGTGRFCSRHCAYAFKKTNGASPKLKAHLDKLRDEGRINAKVPYGTWKCQECQLIFDTRLKLRQHQFEAHGQLFLISKTHDKNQVSGCQCQYCGKVFSKAVSLRSHIHSCPMHPNKELHDKQRKELGKKMRLFFREHPEKTPFFGKHLTSEHKQKLSEARMRTLQNECLDKPYAHVKWYKVKNMRGEEFSVRGHWEENVALRLNELGICWTKSKPLKYFKDYWHNYTPDLYIPSMDIYIEVKGYYPDKDRSKMKLVVQQNPDKKIYFIHDQYREFISGNVPFDDNLLIKESDL